MRLSLEATPTELDEKGEALIRSLVDRVSPFSIELAERLEKALPEKAVKLRYRALRDLQEITRDEYRKTLDKMVAAIGKVLSQAAKAPSFERLEKAQGGPYIGPRGGKWADAQHTIPWEEPDGGGASHNGTFRYGATLRPVSHANVPKGAKHEPHEAFRHGQAVYDRPLTADEIRSYELSPILNDRAIEGRVNRVLDEMHEYADEYRELLDEDPKTVEMTVRQALERQGPAHYDMDAAVKRVIDSLKAPVKPPTQTDPKEGDVLAVDVHPAISGQGGHQEQFRVIKTKGDQVQIGRHEGSDYGPWMPKASLKHFANDLAGKVDLPLSGNPDVDAVISGKAKLLGKGDDGLAFKVDDKVVKVSTTVPYQPENPGHRTPEKAVAMLKRQSEVGNLLADKGIEGVQRSKFVQHGDKGFQIKDYVEIPKKFTRDQLDSIQDTLIAIHKAGYSLNDNVQAGLLDGKPLMFDVGKADTIPEGEKPDGIYSSIVSDMSNMRRLYEDSGHEFVRRDYSDGQRALDRAQQQYDRWLKNSPGMAARHAEKALNLRAKELKATLQGKELDQALDDLDLYNWAMRMEIGDAGFPLPTFGPAEAADKQKKDQAEATKKSLDSGDLQKAGGPFMGPRGGKWADPEHTIPWREDRAGGRKYPVPSIEDLKAQGYTDGQAELIHRNIHDKADTDSWTAERVAQEAHKFPKLSDRVGASTVEVFRVVPKGVTGFNVGDYVFQTRAQAEQFRDEYGRKRGQPEIISTKAPASQFIFPHKDDDELIFAGEAAPKGDASPDSLVEQAHTAVKAEVVESAMRAVAVGADPKTVKYVGAGGEALIFTDNTGKAYRVLRTNDPARREEKVRVEQEAVEALKGTPAEKYMAPHFHADPKQGVIVRAMIEGRPGGWGTKGLREAYEVIKAELAKQDFSAPEYKEDSFIVPEAGGPPVMVDIGFLYPRGKREAKQVTEIVERGDPAMIDLLDQPFAIRNLYYDGHMSLDNALRLTTKIKDMKPEWAANEYKNHLDTLKHTAKEKGDIGKGEELNDGPRSKAAHLKPPPKPKRKPVKSKTAEEKAKTRLLQDGYSGNVITPEMDLGNVEKAIQSQKVEHCALFDGKGNMIARILGGGSSAPILPALAKRIKDAGDVAFTHNHPHGGCFSSEDVVVAVSLNMKEMRAVGGTGTTYVLTRPEKGWTTGLDNRVGQFKHPDGSGRQVKAHAWMHTFLAVQAAATGYARHRMDERIRGAGGTPGDRSHPAFSEEVFDAFVAEENSKALAELFKTWGWGFRAEGSGADLGGSAQPGDQAGREQPTEVSTPSPGAKFGLSPEPPAKPKIKRRPVKAKTPEDENAPLPGHRDLFNPEKAVPKKAKAPRQHTLFAAPEKQKPQDQPLPGQ